jgi:hypothetical protein
MTTILTKKKDTAGAPAPGDLTNSAGGAELAVNTFDKRLYTKDAGGNVVEIGTNPSAIVTTSITDSGNLTFTGTGNRILGDFTNATYSSRVLVQTSTANSATRFNAIPSGTATTSEFGLFNNSNPTNAGYAAIRSRIADVQITSEISGSGTYIPLTMYTGGSERLRIDTSGNVGIGTTNPTAQLDVNYRIRASGPSTPTLELNSTAVGSWKSELLFLNSGVTKWAFGVDLTAAGTNNLYWYDSVNAVNRMTLTSTGSLGIGTSSPVEKLDVRGNIYQLTAGNTTLQQSDGTNNAFWQLNPLSISNSFGAATNNAIPFIVGTNNIERMRIDSSGNVGIKTASPSTTLDIYTNTNSGFHYPLFFSANNSASAKTNYLQLGFSVQQNLAGSETGGFDLKALRNNTPVYLANYEGAAGLGTWRFYTDGTERMRIDSSGNVGIGTSAPAARLDVVGASGGGTQMIVSDGANQGRLQLSKSAAFYGFNAGADYGGIQFFSNGTEHMRIGTTGRVSIGTTAQVARLTVQNISTTDSATIDLRGNRNFVAETFGATSLIAFSDGTRNAHDFGAIRFEQNPATSDGGGALVRLFAGGASSSFAANAEFLRGDARGNTNGVDNIQFRTAGTERMRIDLSGNVGIGTSSVPNYGSNFKNLQVNGSDFGVIQAASGGGTSIVELMATSGVGYVGTRTNNPLVLRTNDTERMRIASNGNVGVGTSSPGAALSVATGINALATLAFGSNNGRMLGKFSANGGTAGKTFNLLTIDSFSSVNTRVFVNVKVMWVDPISDQGNTATAWAGASQGGTRTQGSFTTSQVWSSSTVGSLSWSGNTLRLTTPAILFASCSIDVEFVAFDGAGITFDTSNQ